MILVFPDAATYRLALTSGIVPAEVAASPAAVSFDAGRVAVETDAKLLKKAADELKRLGVTAARKHPAEPAAVSCWPQAVSIEKAPEPSSGTTVLFELPPTEFAAFAAEMLRLGNDKQTFRWVGNGVETRALLKVVGPPHYTLLRALDRPAGPAVRAYVEQAPGVWVELGYAHPLANRVAPPAGQFLFVRSPRDWVFVADAPFRDVYEATQFALPAASTTLRNSPIESKFTVPLKLAPGNATDASELWVLRGPAADGLDRFVRDADDRTLGRLRFALGTDAAGGRVVVLRAATTKEAPPVLALDGAVGYKPYWKLPNLYVPAGRRLHPPLRRDVVRKLLADDADQLVWLAPGSGGAFAPESMPEDAFRSLADWVEYVVETAHAPLVAWVGASRFEFENFVCVDEYPPKSRDIKGPPKTRTRLPEKATEPPPTTSAPATSPDSPPVPQAMPEPSAVKPPGEWVVRRQQLEDSFLAHDGPLDSTERQALWPELAAANAGAGDLGEAGICWANALWDRPTPPPAWLDAWLRAELPSIPRPIPAAEFDKRLSAADPTPGETRQFVAALLTTAHQLTLPKWLRERLPAVQRYLDDHAAKLPVRLTWLAAHRLAQLGGADVLGLARVRDQLLQRLLEDGLNPERNLPHFLRFAGSKDAARARQIREGAGRLHRLVRAWAKAGTAATGPTDQPDHGMTLGYVDLLFAFAQAKLGDQYAAKELVEAARAVLTRDGPVAANRIAGRFLFEAYRHRIDQALAGTPAAGGLPPKLADELDRIQAQGRADFKAPHGTAYYAIARMRNESRILEPIEKIGPYADQARNAADPFRTALADLPRERTPKVLERKVRDLLKSGPDGRPTADSRFQVLTQAVPLAGRVGEAFAVELLTLVSDAMQPTAGTHTPQVADQGKLLERAIFAAAHFDRRDIVKQLVDQFVRLLRAKPADQRYELVNAAAAQGLQSLRRLGLRDEVDHLLGNVQSEILRGRSITEVRDQHRASPLSWAKALQTLLNLAGGWLAFGQGDRAGPVLAATRTDLFAPQWMFLKPTDVNPNKLSVIEYTKLAGAFIAAAGHAPPEDGLSMMADLFRAMEPGWVTNTQSTAGCYSRLHLALAEAVVAALTGDDFALGTAGRRWLDEDEALIRKRIHRDVRQALDRGGL